MIKAPAWLQLLSRSAAALLGGYALSYAASACLARILPLSAADAVIVATLPAFIFFTPSPSSGPSPAVMPCAPGRHWHWLRPLP